MEEAIRLSIIIPAYNAEQYLEKCVDSCQVQDVSSGEYEVIVINDGSTDRTLQIAHSLEEKYRNLVVLNQENQGQSVARNMGLTKANGQYVLFVDADDYLYPNVFGTLIQEEEKEDVDVLITSYQVMQKDGGAQIMNDFASFGKTISGRDALLSGLNIASVCARLYKLSFLKGNNLSFCRGIKHEDVYFNISAYVLARKIRSLGICTYVYQWNDGSTDRSFDCNSIIMGIMSDLEIVRLENDYYNQLGETDPELSSYFKKQSNSLLVSNILTLITKNMRQDLKVYIDKARQYGVFPIKGRTNSWKSSFVARLMNLFVQK